jgi:putative zinc finger/helix-turn-helix YgiT family protein
MTGPRCPICGKGELQRINGDYETRFIDDAARERELKVRGVTRDECSNCGEVFLDDDATQKIESARLQAMRRLAPSEIKAFREKLERTQTEMAHLLGLGEKTYARWESGAYIQNAASDRYLRLLMASEANIAILERLAHQGSESTNVPSIEASIGVTTIEILFPAVAESESLLESAARFTQMLTSGRAFLPRQSEAGGNPCSL